MKLTKLFLFIALCSFASGFGQNITLSLENAQITNDGVDDFYEVDVFISSDADYIQGTGQFLFNYNTAAFGENIQTNGNITYTRPLSSVLGSQTFNVDNYTSFIANDNVSSRTSFLWQQFWSAATIGANNITGTPALLLHMSIRFVDSSLSPDVCFDTTTPFDDQFFTACGGPFPGGADCFSFPGTQILDYSPDCTGGVIATGCAVKTWDGSIWTPAGAPTSTDSVVITGDYDTDTDGGSIDACELSIISASVTVSPGDYIKVEGDIAVDGDSTLTVMHTGNLVQVDDAATVTNDGIINVLVTTGELDGRDFMLMGSPMSMETRGDVFSGALRVRNHLTGNFTANAAVTAASNGAGVWVDEEGDDWPVYNGEINKGEGYMVMRDLIGPATALSLNFNTGTLNNGVTTYSAGYNGSQDESPNIISNPYASAMSATDFINTNTGVVDAVYFWEHVTSPSAGIPGPYGLDYTMEDISIFNLTGGTAASGAGGVIPPNGIISTGQGFGVKVLSGGGPVDVTFNNAMRRTSGNTTLRNQDLDRIWLNVQSEGYQLNSTALIGFLDEATGGLDLGYDTKRLATNVGLYSHLDDGSSILGIQARGTFEENVKIPMGFATLVDEKLNYTISIQNIEGLNLGTATAYLIDTRENVTTNLTESNYTFISEKGIYDNRFILQFTTEGVLGTNGNLLETVSLYPNPTKNVVTIVSPQMLVTSATVFDIRGRIVSEVDFSNQTNYQIDLSSMESAAYFIEITTENGTVTKKVIKQD